MCHVVGGGGGVLGGLGLGGGLGLFGLGLLNSAWLW